MSQSTSLEQLFDRLANALEGLLRAVAEDATDDRVASTAAELWDVVAELEDVLETVDLERLPEAVDAAALPDVLELERLSEAIRERDPDLALDLDALRRAIELRELWNAVDLAEFGRESEQLRNELEDVLGPDAFDSGDCSEPSELEAVAEEVKGEATNAAFQQEVRDRIEPAREAVIDAHATVEELYESHQRGPGSEGRRPTSNNPTAASSMPVGPLPASASTRVSTVPTDVRHAKVETFPHVYGRRWRSARRG
ncbi:hypothetical protein [Natronococcus occultus]|uniref:Uncharacterized protein n=1 Tax=Natronococcus occultus SP4 TaxID=694430 RepID=L0JZY7_9EURY|nr:hypothetical protein [Natronococcus occultus]AGB37850.1 hypothetical protein Natoc_2064 [Natronococcus occultus SP4]